MKVVFVSTLLPETNYFRYLAQALEKTGVDISVYADKRPENKEVGLSNVELVWTKSILYPFQILKRLKNLEGETVVHLHHEVGMFGGARTAVLYPFLVLGLKLLGFKVVTTIHAVVAPDQVDEAFLETFAFPPSPYLIWPVRLFFTFLYLMLVKFSDKIIVHSQSLAELLLKHYKASRSKVVIIPHGVPEQVPMQNPKPSAAWSTELLSGSFACYFGYFHRRKGLEYVIEAFSSLAEDFPELKLVLAGGTIQKDYENYLKQWVAELGLADKVIFTGFVDQSELYWLLENSLFVLQPATYSISASGPLAQVIAFEKPVICNQVGVFAEEIVDGENGLLALTRSSEDMEEKMRMLLTDDALRTRLAQGMQKLHQERVWPEIARRTADVYRKLLV